MSQPRYNPRTQHDDWYYRIKESFRDLTGRVRSRIMLNVGFIEEAHRPEDIRDIGAENGGYPPTQNGDILRFQHTCYRVTDGDIC